MIDLHIHTNFSDGEIDDLLPVTEQCKVISITDHNTIRAYAAFAEALKNTKIIIGCEITVNNAPDYLLYFPHHLSLNELEHELENIRLKEERVIRACYYRLGYTNWEIDIARAYSTHQKVRNARTRDLAAIIHLYNTDLNYDEGKFNPEDLKIARLARWRYSTDIGDPIPTDIAFDIANKYDGKIVLAHPIRTALKRCPRGNVNISILKENLTELLRDYVPKSGRTIEWEYLEDHSLQRHGLSFDKAVYLRNIIMDATSEYDFTFTIGSDSHSLKNYNSAVSWLYNNHEILNNHLAEWLK